MELCARKAIVTQTKTVCVCVSHYFVGVTGSAGEGEGKSPQEADLEEKFWSFLVWGRGVVTVVQNVVMMRSLWKLKIWWEDSEMQKASNRNVPFSVCEKTEREKGEEEADAFVLSFLGRMTCLQAFGAWSRDGCACLHMR